MISSNLEQPLTGLSGAREYDDFDAVSMDIIKGRPFWSSYWNAIVINNHGEMYYIKTIGLDGECDERI